MEGHVLLPRLGKRGNVSFIFDTGADTSLLMPLDAQRMGIDYGAPLKILLFRASSI